MGILDCEENEPAYVEKITQLTHIRLEHTMQPTMPEQCADNIKHSSIKFQEAVRHTLVRCASSASHESGVTLVASVHVRVLESCLSQSPRERRGGVAASTAAQRAPNNILTQGK